MGDSERVGPARPNPSNPTVPSRQTKKPPAGEAFLHEARKVLAQLQHAAEVVRGVAQGLFKDQLNAVDVHYLISALSGFRVDHAATWHSLLQVDLLGENLRARHLQLLLAQLSALVCKEQG